MADRDAALLAIEIATRLGTTPEMPWGNAGGSEAIVLGSVDSAMARKQGRPGVGAPSRLEEVLTLRSHDNGAIAGACPAEIAPPSPYTEDSAHALLIRSAAAGAFAREEDLVVRSRFGWIEAHCRSPIEKLLAAAMLAAFGDLGPSGHDNVCRRPGGEPVGEFENPDSCFDVYRYIASQYHDHLVIISPQCPVGSYRADFVLSYVFWGCPPDEVDVRKRFCIECDGHEFHERTKEQARRDRARDRWFQAEGFAVLRFTGSEIFADAQKCAAEIHAQARNWLDQQRRLVGYPEEAFV